MDEKSSQTSEMAVKISEKRSELALEQAFMPKKRRSMRDYTAEWPMYDDTVLCCIFESQNVPKSWLFWRMLKLLNIERLNFKQYLDFDSVAHTNVCLSASTHASTRHMIKQLILHARHMIQTAVIRLSHTVLSRKRAHYGMWAHPPIVTQFPAKV